MPREKNYIPQYNEESMIFASLYSTKLYIGHLRFLLRYGKESNSDMIRISYNEMQLLGDNWRDDLSHLLNISFPVMYGSIKGSIHWIDCIMFDDEEEVFIFSFSKPVQNIIRVLAEKYNDDFCKIIQFCRLRTFFIYRYLKSKMQDKPFLSLTHEEVKVICNYEEENYQSLGELKRAVLNKAVDEINRYLDWNLAVLIVYGNIEFRKA